MRYWFLVLFPAALLGQTPARRHLVPGDIYRMKDVGSPAISPDGQWVAYTVATLDSAKDKRNVDVYMVSWDGARTVRLTSSPDAESSPKWSPDNRYLAFLSGRGDEEKGAQLWLLDRQGGEAQKVTDIKAGVGDYEWAADSKRLVLVVTDPDPDTTAGADKKTPKPIEIDRWDFKRDYEGYLNRRREHLYLFDLGARKAEQLTSGDWDDASPNWSPDGTRIAFASKRAEGSDRNDNSDIYVVEAKLGSEPKALTTFVGRDGEPNFSPDGKSIAFLRSGDPKFWAYNNQRVAVVPAAGGVARV